MTRLRAITLAAALFTGAGCAGNGDEALLILQNQFPDDGCVISAQEGSLVQDDGTLDVLGGTGYLFTPLVKNTTLGETGTEAQRRVFIKGARIDIRFANVELFSDAELQMYDDIGLTRFEVPLAGSVSPDGGTIALSFEIIQAALTRVLTDKISGDAELLVLADVKVLGELGGGDIESQTFTFAVRVCAGCLINVVAACDALPDAFMPREGNPCNPFQDGTVDCCSTGAAEQLRCPAF
jgi:hypothetical protein